MQTAPVHQPVLSDEEDPHRSDVPQASGNVSANLPANPQPPVPANAGISPEMAAFIAQTVQTAMATERERLAALANASVPLPSSVEGFDAVSALDPPNLSPFLWHSLAGVRSSFPRTCCRHSSNGLVVHECAAFQFSRRRVVRPLFVFGSNVRACRTARFIVVSYRLQIVEKGALHSPLRSVLVRSPMLCPFWCSSRDHVH